MHLFRTFAVCVLGIVPPLSPSLTVPKVFALLLLLPPHTQNSPLGFLMCTEGAGKTRDDTNKIVLIEGTVYFESRRA